MDKKIYYGAGLAALLLLIMKQNELKSIVVNNLRTTYDSLFQKYGNLYGVDWKLLKAICYVESTLGLNRRVKRGLEVPTDIEGSKSTDGKSWGLMQLRPETARQFDPLANEIKLNNAEYSINIAAQYVAWVQRFIAKLIPASDPRFLEFVIKSYNQGVGNTQKEIRGLNSGYANSYYQKFDGLIA